MLYVFIILIIFIVLYLFFLLRSITSKKIKTNSDKDENEPRDFILNADIWLKPPVELRFFVDNNKDDAVKFLEGNLSDGAMHVRKYAAYALGQIGDHRLSEVFDTLIKRETDQSMIDVMKACHTALQVAPSEKGFTEYQRRLIIDNISKSKSINNPEQI